jgi:hypothetical protein
MQTAKWSVEGGQIEPAVTLKEDIVAGRGCIGLFSGKKAERVFATDCLKD